MNAIIIESVQELENKLSEIKKREREAKKNHTDMYGSICVTSDLIPLIGATGRQDADFPEDSPLFKGVDSVLVTEVSYSADYRDLKEPIGLHFFLDRRLARCIKVGKMYLWYAALYGSNTKQPCVYNESALMIKWKSEAKQGIDVPNNIGVLTAKKLKDWTDFYAKVQENCEKLEREACDRIEQFRSKLRKVCPDKADDNSGNVVINGIEFMWKIDSKGYIKERTQIYYKFQYGIDNFLHLISH